MADRALTGYPSRSDNEIDQTARYDDFLDDGCLGKKAFVGKKRPLMGNDNVLLRNLHENNCGLVTCDEVEGAVLVPAAASTT